MSRSPAYHRGRLNWVIGIVEACVRFKVPTCRFCHSLTLRAAKEQPDVMSYIPCILSLACNWSIGTSLKFAAPNYGSAF